MKSTLARLFSPAYMWNTIRVKWKANRLGSNVRVKPYELFKDVKKSATLGELTFAYSDFYTSFGYMNYETASDYYSDSPSTIHQIMLAIFKYNDIVSTSTNHEADVNWVLAQAKEIYGKATKNESYITFPTNEKYDRFDLEGERYSGIIQAKAASLFIRSFKVSGDPVYLDWARESLQACMIPKEENGITRNLENGTLWVEEYASPTPSMVLNGFLFVVIALAEYCDVKEDAELKDFYQKCLTSLITWLPLYRVGNDMLYSMYHWALCNVHYQGIVKYQMDHLYELTDINEFKDWSEFLGKNINWDVFRWLFR